MRFAPDRNEEERTGAVVNILKANAGEAWMMARCAGKTRLHNIEPEDLRSVTRATAAVTGIPLAGTEPRRPANCDQASRLNAWLLEYRPNPLSQFLPAAPPRRIISARYAARRVGRAASQRYHCRPLMVDVRRNPS